ncbi:MAG: hypothetical protein HOC20_03385 [Chloroflexi bacterium]|nr:hypothetical protein [Chloroflexota bacterium]
MAIRFSSRPVIGCVPCVRVELLKEAFRSLFLGWFSPHALVLNPFFILHNLICALIARPNPEGVKHCLEDIRESREDESRKSTVTERIVCPECGHSNSEHRVTCKVCRINLRESISHIIATPDTTLRSICHQCGKPVSEDWIRCPNCGEWLDELS